MVSKDQDWVFQLKFGADTVQHIFENNETDFVRDKPYRRNEIINIVWELCKEEGVLGDGDKEKDKESVTAAVKKQLPKEEGSTKYGFRKLKKGVYLRVGTGEQTESDTDLANLGAEDGQDDTGDTILEPGEELGKGPCEVYAWCLPLPQDKKTGDRWPIKTSDRWPIKIGWAGPGGFNRRWKKDFASYLPVLPKYLIRIRCETEEQAKSWEQLIHLVLKNRGHQVENIPGTEWFKTNPDEIKDIINFSDPNFVASG